MNRLVDDEWIPIKDFEDYAVNKTGEVMDLTSGELLKQHTNNWGYRFISLRDKDNIRNILMIHRLVYQAFKGDIMDGFEINHIDEDKTNNNLDNLESVSHKTNMKRYTDNHPAHMIMASNIAAVKRRKEMLVKCKIVSDLLIKNKDEKVSELLPRANRLLELNNYKPISYITLLRYSHSLND